MSIVARSWTVWMQTTPQKATARIASIDESREVRSGMVIIHIYINMLRGFLALRAYMLLISESLIPRF
jgi:hypothetical protein